MIHFIILVSKKKSWQVDLGEWKTTKFPARINNLFSPDGEVASISWKYNDECMQVKSGARDADTICICEFHKGSSKLQLSEKKYLRERAFLKH